jgi:protein-L-isoaspartate(D-aspartate) O-methyltransferase
LEIIIGKQRVPVALQSTCLVSELKNDVSKTFRKGPWPWKDRENSTPIGSPTWISNVVCMSVQKPTRISFVRLCCFCLLLAASSSLMLGAQGSAPGEDPQILTDARRTMVQRDISRRGIKDQRLLRVLGTLPRHLFVPEELRSSAYDDRPLPIGAGQTISQPYIVAVMTELLGLKGRERVLEIGTGSGYQTAVLAALAEQVFSVEIVAELSARAEKTLKHLGTQNVKLRVGNGFHGWAEEEPFDAIIVTAAAPGIPPPLWNQLREGGVLIMPLGKEGQTQQLIRARKIGGRQVIEEHSAVIFVPLTGGTQKAPR